MVIDMSFDKSKDYRLIPEYQFIVDANTALKNAINGTSSQSESVPDPAQELLQSSQPETLPKHPINPSAGTPNYDALMEALDLSGYEELYPYMTQTFRNNQKELYEMFIKKNTDYGCNNILLGGSTENEDDVRFATMGLIIRMSDKINRLRTLVKGDTANYESIDDTLRDLANYAVIALVLRSGNWGK